MKKKKQENKGIIIPTVPLRGWPKRKKQLKQFCFRTTADPVFAAFVVLFAMALIIISLSWRLGFYKAENIDNILAEAHGMLLDIAVIGLFLLWLNKLGEKRLEKRRYQEEIDDFRGWKSEEAACRIKGNIRRLNRAGVNNIDLSYCFLREANLRAVQLQRANLEHADLQGALLYGAKLQGASLKWANLQGAYLQEADLSDTNLKGSNFQRATMGYAWSSDDDDAFLFRRTDLQNALLEDADIRGVLGLSVKQLSRVKTLYKARIDTQILDEIRQAYPHLLQKPSE